MHSNATRGGTKLRRAAPTRCSDYKVTTAFIPMAVRRGASRSPRCWCRTARDCSHAWCRQYVCDEKRYEVAQFSAHEKRVCSRRHVAATFGFTCMRELARRERRKAKDANPQRRRRLHVREHLSPSRVGDVWGKSSSE